MALCPGWTVVMPALAACLLCAEGRQGGPEWLAGEEAEAHATETMTTAERMRRDFEAERQRLQEQRRKGGHTAARAASVRLRCCPPIRRPHVPQEAPRV